jgi:hypothetical protein
VQIHASGTFFKNHNRQDHSTLKLDKIQSLDKQKQAGHRQYK